MSDRKLQKTLLSSQGEGVTLAWRDINVWINERRGSDYCFKRPGSTRAYILNDVTGVALPGELLAILGPSGAGKTTLLNALTGSTSRGARLSASGRLSVNGKAISDRMTSSAYVQQKDLFIGSLTVREHLTFHAALRMSPKRFSRERRVSRVNDVMDELFLTECQNTVIGVPGIRKGLSGGEMKRLSFASEVLTNPSLIFCDEPTSGLDSFMAQSVIRVLKNMAVRGKTIITTIHQPSSEVYNMFDKTLVLADGRLAFLGTNAQALDLFRALEMPCPSTSNPADHFIRLLKAKLSPGNGNVDAVCDAYRSSSVSIEMISKAESLTEETTGKWFSQGRKATATTYATPWTTQFRFLLWRFWLSAKKEPETFRNQLIQAAVVGAIVGCLFFDQKIDEYGTLSICGVLIICVGNRTYQTFYAVLHTFHGELAVFYRENLKGLYRTDAYFLAKSAAELPLLCVTPTLFMAMIYFTVGLNPFFVKFLTALLVIIMVTNAAASFGYLISSLSSNLSVALSNGPPVLSFLFLISGFLRNLNSVPSFLEYLVDISWVKHSYEALMINQWADVKNITCSGPNTMMCPSNGRVVLELYGFKENNFTTDLIGLMTSTVGLRLLAFLAFLLRSYWH